ncbi:MAG: hypothetical protein ACREI8_13825 [Myxococcota bacterium]
MQQQGEAALHGQAIPLDPELHRVESYRSFLEARRNELARPDERAPGENAVGVNLKGNPSGHP